MIANALSEYLKYTLLKMRISQKAQGLIEYALIILLIVIVVIVILSLLGVQVGNLFQDINEAMP